MGVFDVLDDSKDAMAASRGWRREGSRGLKYLVGRLGDGGRDDPSGHEPTDQDGTRVMVPTPGCQHHQELTWQVLPT